MGDSEGLGTPVGESLRFIVFFYTRGKDAAFKRKESKQRAATLSPKQTVCRLVTYCSMVRSVCAEQDQRSECVYL